jgi:hypothetical protein
MASNFFNNGKNGVGQHKTIATEEDAPVEKDSAFSSVYKMIQSWSGEKNDSSPDAPATS